jgi:hypothetical protein
VSGQSMTERTGICNSTLVLLICSRDGVANLETRGTRLGRHRGNRRANRVPLRKPARAADSQRPPTARGEGTRLHAERVRRLRLRARCGAGGDALGRRPKGAAALRSANRRNSDASPAASTLGNRNAPVRCFSDAVGAGTPTTWRAAQILEVTAMPSERVRQEAQEG